MSFAGILLILYAVVGLLTLVTRIEDYEKTINQGYPAGDEVKVNFWTRKAKVSKKNSDR
jgi:hypothetical protein